jgi:NitT/TauT family transport system substrate-binding protein
VGGQVRHQIEVVQINDYVESINQYTAGAFDGCVMTNMDALTIPAAGGVDSTALIVGDFSNGNDAVILKGKTELKDIKGQQVNLVELSVSHYLLARGLEYGGPERARHQGGQHLRRRHGGRLRRRGSPRW